MLFARCLSLAIASLPFSSAAVARINNEIASVQGNAASRMGARPLLPFDPNTTPYCSWWLDNTGSQACQNIPASWAITMADFLRWNPSITSTCGNFVTGRSYCVEAEGEPPVATTSTTVRTTTAQPSVTRTTSTIITTTTTAGNGIATPNPIQPGIPSNCDAFHLIKSGDSCAAIASTYGITTAKLISWNAEIGPNCQSLWVDYYICVSIVGEEPASPSPTTTAPSNGVPTPDPVQPGIVNNCNAFHKIQSGDTCDKITALYGISRTQLNSWNAEIGSACQFIWVDYYICVGVIGTTPRPTTTSVGNGIATPTPIQPGMVNNCDAFYRVQSGDTCDKITAAHGISRAQLSSWNAEIGNACQFIWVDYYICVSIVGVDPSPTQPGNGIATPVPIQTGMTNNCRRFYFVRSGDTCASVARGAGISEATFYSWNTGVGSSCSALWLDTWYCIGV